MKSSIFFILLLVFASVTAQENTKIAVMDLKPKTGLDEPTASMLTDVLCSAIKDLGQYKVISREDIKAMLTHVKDQQLLGCDDTKCLAEIGGALGVPLSMVREKEHISMLRNNPDGTKTPLTMPDHSKLKASTLRTICTQAGINREEFLNAFRKA